ncbi:MAG: (d)CMP kinase [Veillonellales bacterium]
MKKLIMAIDGPAGAGKSTVAQIVAQRLNYTYIDTGAMYRAVTWQALAHNLTCAQTEQIARIARNYAIRLQYVGGKTKVLLEEKDITLEIRSPEVTRMVAGVAQISTVREAMLHLQRDMAKAGGVVMDGRDIGTYVLPNADIKLFLTASIEKRAERRWRELRAKGMEVDFEQLKQEITCRDQMDCERDIAPLVQAPDAVFLDTTHLSIEETVQAILQICRERAEIV